MAPTPPLKRRKTNADKPPQRPPTPSQVPLPPDSPQRPKTPQAQVQDASPSTRVSTRSTSPSDVSRQSWFKGWPRKATPVTQVARESISKATDAASETASILSDRIKERRPSRATRTPSLAMTLGKTTSNRSLPADATMSKIHATSEAGTPSRKASLQVQPPRSPTKQRRGTSGLESTPGNSEAENIKTAETPSASVQGVQPPPKIPVPAREATEQQKKGQDQMGWFGWMSKPTYDTREPQLDKPPEATSRVPADNNVPLISNIKADATPNGPVTDTKPAGSAQPEAVHNASSNKRTWLQMWSADPADEEGRSAVSKGLDTQAVTTSNTSKSLDIPKPSTSSKSASQASSIETSPPPPLPGDPTRSAGWIFWSRDKKTNTIASSSAEQPHHGEIAISDTPSQTRPKRSINQFAQR